MGRGEEERGGSDVNKYYFEPARWLQVKEEMIQQSCPLTSTHAHTRTHHATRQAVLIHLVLIRLGTHLSYASSKDTDRRPQGVVVCRSGGGGQSLDWAGGAWQD